MRPVDGPAYPGSDDGAHDTPEPEMGWGAKIVLAAVMVAIALIVVLHLTGTVGPAAH